MRKVSLEKEIASILANGKSSETSDSNIKVSTSKGCRYEYPAHLEEELKKAAKTLFRKKPERFPVPKVQKVLLVFSKNRGKVDEIVKAVDECRGYRIVSPLTELGVSEKDAYTLYSYARHIPYALSIMPKAYM